MSQFFYTAIFRPTTGEVLREDNFLAAEHFADEAERNKRAKQFETHARSLGEVDPWMVYSGQVPVEVYLARSAVAPKEGEEQADWAARVQAAGDKVTKTVSVLTAPEVDDSELVDHSDPANPVVIRPGRELPAWALAQHAVEAAELAVRDAQDGVDSAQKRADEIITRVFSTAHDRPAAVAAHAEWEKKTLIAGAPGADARVSYDDRRQAVAAQTEVDQQKARLYRAEEELKARKADIAPLVAARDAEAEQRAKEAQKK